MSLRATLTAATLALVLAVGGGGPPRPVQAGAGITDYAVPGANPNAITLGPDGNLWFTEGTTGANPVQAIGRITASGEAVTWPLPHPNSQPTAIAAGPDGRLWFNEYSASSGPFVGHIDTDGSHLTELLIPNGVATGITAGPDGNVWFSAAVVGGHIDRVNVQTGAINEVAAASQPTDITSGPDGNLWYIGSGAGGGVVGRVTIGGLVTDFALPGTQFQGARPSHIATGPDGNLWVTVDNLDRIDRVTPTGVVTEFPIPTAFNHPQGITGGPDGNMWFTEAGYSSKVGRLNIADGTVLEANLPNSPAGAKGITAGPGSSIWFTEAQASRVGTLTVPFTFPPYGPFTATDPTRILDTRTSGTRLGPGQTLDVAVAGQAGTPQGAAAAVINVTVTNSSAASYLTLYPLRAPRPTASNLNFVAGQTIANLTQVALGSGSVTIYNAEGLVDVILDLNGWFAGTPTAGQRAGQFIGFGPSRLLDTRTETGGHQAPLGPGESLDLQVTGRFPNTGFDRGLGAVLNVAAVNGSRSSYLTVYPSRAATRPLASNLNFPPFRNLANRGQVRLGDGGAVSIYNSEGTVDVVVDFNGWYMDGTEGPGFIGAYYHPMAPVRLADTRPATQVGPVGTPLAGGATLAVQVTGQAGVPSAGLFQTVVLNVTVTNPTAGSFLTVYPYGLTAPPLASDLNFGPGENLPNLVVVSLGIQNGKLTLYNDQGSVDLVVDVAGWYG